MHILGILGVLVTALYLLDRLGIDIGWLNPWAWRRRRAWSKKYESDPIYSIDEPIQAAAVFVVGTAKLQGDLTVDQKTAVLEQFEQEFSLSARGASELLSSVAHLLGAPQLIRTQLDGVLSRNRQTFNADQAQSLIRMTESVAAAGGELSDDQRSFIEQMRSTLIPSARTGKWTKRSPAIRREYSRLGGEH